MLSITAKAKKKEKEKEKKEEEKMEVVGAAWGSGVVPRPARSGSSSVAHYCALLSASFKQWGCSDRETRASVIGRTVESTFVSWGEQTVSWYMSGMGSWRE